MNFCVVAAAVALLVSHKAICADARIIGSENSNLNAQTLSLTVEALSASANINSNDANADAAVNATVNLFKLANQLSSLVSSNNTAAISTVLQEIQLLLQGADYNPSGALDILSAVSEALAEIESGSFDPASLAEIATAVAQVSSTDAIVWLAVLANQLSDLAPSNNTGEISKVLQEMKTLLLSVRNEPIGLPTILSTVSKAPAEIKSGLNDSDRLRKIASAVAQVSSTDAINRLHSLAKELIFQAAYNEKVVAVLRQTTTLLRSLLNSAPKKYGSAIADLATSVVAVEASFLRGDVTQASLTEVATKIAQFAANAALDNYTDILNALWMQSSALTSNGKNPEIKKILQEIREILSRIGLVAKTLRDPIQAVISIVSAAPNNPSSTTFLALSDSLSDLIKTLQQLGDLSLF